MQFCPIKIKDKLNLVVQAFRLEEGNPKFSILGGLALLNEGRGGQVGKVTTGLEGDHYNAPSSQQSGTL